MSDYVMAFSSARARCSLIPRTIPFALQFAVTIIHISRRAVDTGKASTLSGRKESRVQLQVNLNTVVYSVWRSPLGDLTMN